MARHFFQQLLEAVEYCHKKGYSHGDLKLNNMLLDENFNIKLADFGFAQRVSTVEGKSPLKMACESPLKINSDDYFFGTPMYFTTSNINSNFKF